MDTGIQPTSVTLPGTSFHAPQARLVTEEGSPVTIEGRPITPDIVSVSVTLLNTGTAQTEIVLNNQRHDKNERPVVPTWRYNKMDEVGFGKRVRVDFRYGAEGWTPMILARITDMGFVFPNATGALATLKGEDLMSLLKVKPAEEIPHKDKDEIEMVEAELTASKSGLKLVSPRSDFPFKTKLKTVTHKKADTFFKFISDFADRMDFEVFVAFDNPAPGKAAPNPTTPDKRTVSFHFEPSRSTRLGEPIALQWGRDFNDFKPTFAVWSMLTKVTSGGGVPQGRGQVNGKAELAMETTIFNDLHTSPKGKKPINAAAARKTAFGDENNAGENTEELTVANIDAERAQLAAVAKLRGSVRQFLTADITTIGVPKLQPGLHVDLAGLYAPFDGVYYVTKAVHTLSAAGYLTVLSLRRPGMLNPSEYPGSAS